MLQNELKPAPGSRKDRKRVGRGNGSGHGTFSGRGIKGQKSRSGVQIQRGFEGGQLPIIKRLPRKRGFHNLFRVEYSPVNIGALNIFDPGTEVTPELLFNAGLIDSLDRPVKILADGELKHALIVKASKFSEAAKAKIEAVGGKVEEI
ncbi:MAG: 50S ribosomal protein L15 [Dehalococcoidales bacterium]|jgi:large subunit ribosomal protein L15|nr:50S ribosomal protein L15 [Dehalococcoidales bacterium]